MTKNAELLVPIRNFKPASAYPRTRAQDASAMQTPKRNDSTSPPVLSRTKPDSRLSTLHRWPQYLFPSRWNHLASDLSVPYAFSHHSSSFYWTRDDALNDIRWNIFAKPPCLNCVVRGEVNAKNCDRMRRQEKSFGCMRCCSSCEEEGAGGDACVETIEVRIDEWGGMGRAMDEAERRFTGRRGNGQETVVGFDAGQGRRLKTFVDETTWMESEKKLRREGVVVWRPINLHVGDVGTKKEVVEQFERGTGRSVSQATFTEDPTRFFRKIADIEIEYDVRDNMRRRVAEWDMQTDAENLQAKLDEVLHSPETLPSPLVPASDPADGTSTTIYQPRDLELHDVCEHWSYTLTRAQADLYNLEVKGLGRTAATLTAEKWAQDAEQVMPQVSEFLAEKLKAIVEEGMDVDEANKAAEDTLTETARYWLRRLVPEMMTT